MSPLSTALYAATDFGHRGPFAKLASIAGERALEREIRGERDGVEWGPAGEFFAILLVTVGEAKTRTTIRCWRMAEDRRRNTERRRVWAEKAENFAEFGVCAVGKKTFTTPQKRSKAVAVVQIMPRLTGGTP